MWTMRALVLLIVVMLPGVLLGPVWLRGGLGAGEDDILYYYPMRVFLHEAVNAGQWPWLNPWTGLGRPFVSDPQTALWYPPTWLFAVFEPRVAYPLNLWLHFSLAILGMYRLLRSERVDRRAALFGGVAFAFCGFMLAHRAHFTMQHAAAWAPWVFWRLQRYVADDAASAGVQLRRLVAAALVCAAQCLAGHVQIALLTAAGALVYLVVRLPGWRAIVLRWTIAWVCAAGVFAVQWFPTLLYMRHCTRVERTYSDFVENSWNPLSIIGFLLPMFFGQRTPNFFNQPYWGPSHQVEQFAYAGLLPLMLAILALRAGWRGDRQRRAWLVVGVLGLLTALGEYGPVCPILYWLPGSSLFRVPARALLLVSMALVALAALTLRDLGPLTTPDRARLRATLLRWTSLRACLAVTAIATVIALIVPRPAGWVPATLAIITFATLAHIVRQWRSPGWLWLVPLVTTLDLGVIGWTIDVPRGVRSPEALTTPAPRSAWYDLVRDSGHRLWVVTDRAASLVPGEYVQPVDKAVANTNILRHIRTLTDYGPLQPRSIADRFGFKPWGESTRADELLADTRWMRAYDVGWLLVCDEQRTAPAGCRLHTITPQGWRLYHNPTAGGLAMLENAAQPGVVRVESHSPAHVTTVVDTWAPPGSDDTPPRLVLSRAALPGWSAYVDGRRVRTETVDGVLLGLSIPRGRVLTIEWRYFPPGLGTGAAITLITLGLLVAAVGFSRGRSG